jgi:glycosyltransferase involved in cell wall biosynthesis
VRVHQYPPPDSPFQRRKQRFVVRHPGLARRLSRWLLSFDALLRSKPEVVCLSLGDTYVLGLHREYHFLIDALISRSIPYVVVVQLSVDHWEPDAAAAAVTRRAFEHGHRVGFVSEHNRQLVRRQLNAALPNAVVIRNPVNLSDISAVPWPAGPARLASVARLQLHHKGQDLLLHALGQPQWRQRDWRLRLYGEGPDAAEVGGLVERLSLKDRVEFVGHVGDVRALWADNHLLVMPSLMEGTPLALVEAMLCGRPGVCNPAGGIPEWIEDGRGGFLATQVTADAFAAALERAWQDRERWEAMGADARERALQLYDPQPGRTLLNQLIDAARDRSPA